MNFTDTVKDIVRLKEIKKIRILGSSQKSEGDRDTKCSRHLLNSPQELWKETGLIRD